ncbi:MAG: hypothetical protein K2X53_04985, partial [Alphaproteobacteria bacterium]|nr:hypothetical protein [Alphaproteobacteria bacterium]
MKNLKILKKGAVLLTLLFPLMTAHSWASDSDDEGCCFAGSPSNQIVHTEKSQLINDGSRSEEEPGCCTWFWCCLWCGSDDAGERTSNSYVVQNPIVTPKKQHGQGTIVLEGKSIPIQFPLYQQEGTGGSQTLTSSHQGSGESSMRVKVTDIKQTVQGYDATITPILQHPSSSTPPSITGRQPQNSSHSSDESPCTSFNQEEWNSVQQSTLLVYKEIFSALTSKKLPDQDTLREIHTKRDTNALTDLMMSETSDGHFFDLTRICHGMRDFVDITLPDSVIALSEGL